MAWVTPSTQSTGALILASRWNQDVVANAIALYSGSLSVASQAQHDVMVASSTTQMERLYGSSKLADLGGAVIKSAEFRGFSETRQAVSIAAGVLTLDFAAGPVFEVTINANITSVVFQNLPASGLKGTIELWCKGNGTGYTQAGWANSATVRWPGDQAVTLTTTNGDYTQLLIQTMDGGTNIFYTPVAQAW